MIFARTLLRLLTPVLRVTLAGVFVSLIFLVIGYPKFSGFALIVAAVAGEFVHINSGWRKYLSDQYGNDMWVTTSGVATSAGLVLDKDLYLLSKVLLYSPSENRMEKTYAKFAARKLDACIQISILAIGLFGTFISLF